MVLSHWRTSKAKTRFWWTTTTAPSISVPWVCYLIFHWQWDYSYNGCCSKRRHELQLREQAPRTICYGCYRRKPITGKCRCRYVQQTHKVIMVSLNNLSSLFQQTKSFLFVDLRFFPAKQETHQVGPHSRYCLKLKIDYVAFTLYIFQPHRAILQTFLWGIYEWKGSEESNSWKYAFTSEIRKLLSTLHTSVKLQQNSTDTLDLIDKISHGKAPSSPST